jgi:hypothetical protein
MLINKKRSRSISEDSSLTKKRKIDNKQFLLTKATAIDASSKILCHFCQKDISKSIRIICDECIDMEYCLDCLVLGKGNGGKPHKHDYHIVDKLDFPIFTSDWTTNEELMLLSSKLLLNIFLLIRH